MVGTDSEKGLGHTDVKRLPGPRTELSCDVCMAVLQAGRQQMPEV